MGIVAILLVNMLIAMMGNTYQKIAETRNEWQRQVTEAREVHRILLASLVYLLSIYCCFQSLGLHCINPLNAELNPICPLLALLAHHILHVSRMSVK